MNKILPFVLCLLPLSLFAAGVEPEPHQVFLNGKPFSHAVLVSGVWAIPLEDVERGCNASNSHGSELYPDAAGRVKVKFSWDRPGSPTPPSTTTRAIATRASTAGTLFSVNREGVITNHALMKNGKAFVSLADFAQSFGGVWRPPAGGLAPGAIIQLNFAKNPNAILIGL